MAFDKVFESDPSQQGIAAPGTRQSPSFGVDVVDKTLWISAGQGWEEVSGGGGGTPGGANGNLQYNNSGAFGGAGLTDGNHFALGPDATIDNDPAEGPISVVLEVTENYTDSGIGNNGVYGINGFIDWSPTVDAADGVGAYGAGFQVSVDLDGQATTSTENDGAFFGCDNASTTRHVFATYGVVGAGTSSGTGPQTQAAGVLGEASATGGANIEVFLACLYADGLDCHVDGGSHVPIFAGLMIDAGPVIATGTVDRVSGIEIGDITNGGAGGTTNFQIHSTGHSPSDFAGPLGATTFRAHTVYSVAGTPLPSAVTEGVGARAFVSDATANTFNTAYTGGGADKVPVFSDGTVWRVG